MDPITTNDNPRHPHTFAVDKRRVFQLRCWARAYLWTAGEILWLAEAVDVLQKDAEASGLVAEIGMDEVQRILSAAFGMARRP